jgi:SNF family Na+-dependent transporter
MDAIILFGGVFILVGLPLIIMGFVSGRRAEQSKKEA